MLPLWGREEIVDHLLLHCSKAKILWDLLLAIFGVSWVFPHTVETLLSWHGSFVGKRRKKAWMAAPPLHFLDNLAGKKLARF